MSDEASLLLAIKRAPEDDEPRRRYADLLVKHGHPRGRWMHAQLDAADSGRSAEERAAAAREAAACFEAALLVTDTRARSDLARGRPVRLAFLKPRPEAPEVCVARLGMLSRLLGSTAYLETIYDLHYHRGMLTGIDLRSGVGMDRFGVTPVLGRAPVRWLRCAGRLVALIALDGGLTALHKLQLFGEVSGEELLREVTCRRSELQELELSEAILRGERAVLAAGLPRVTLRWPAGEERPPVLEPVIWSVHGASDAPSGALQLIGPAARGGLVLSQTRLCCWGEGTTPGVGSGAEVFKKALKIAQGRESGAWIAAGVPRKRGAPVTLYRGQGEAPLTRLIGSVEPPVAVTISEDGQGAAWEAEGGTVYALHPRFGERPVQLSAPESGYQALLWLPGDAALLGRRGEVIDWIGLPPGEEGAAPALDSAHGLCVMEGLEAPVDWPSTQQTPPLLVCDPATADVVRRLDRGAAVGYSAARGVVALQSPLGVTLWSLRTGEELAVLPCVVERAMIHPTLPCFFGLSEGQVVGATLPPQGVLVAEARFRLVQPGASAIAVDGPWGRYTFEGSYAPWSGGDVWGGWEGGSYAFALSRRGEQLWVLIQYTHSHLGGESVTDSWYTSQDGGRTFEGCGRPEGELEPLSDLSAVG